MEEKWMEGKGTEQLLSVNSGHRGKSQGPKLACCDLRPHCRESVDLDSLSPISGR